jgi:hypothetical protein
MLFNREERLRYLAHRINKHEMTATGAAKLLFGDEDNPIASDPHTFKRYCVLMRIRVEPKKGRSMKVVENYVKDLVKQIRGHRPLGATLMHQVLLHKQIQCTRRDTLKIYDDCGLYRYRKTSKPENLHTSDYEAIQKNLIWHTDLHNITDQYEDGESVYIIAFIDDASRRIMGWSLLQDKTSLTTKHVLESILDNGNQPQPHTVWTDNGKEFMGEFEDFLQNRGIKHHTTNVHTPQQNGKIERFWQKVDDFGDDGTTFQARIDEYNETPHLRLPKGDTWDGTGAKDLTPNEKYNELENWTRERRQWRVKNIIKHFN